MYALHHHLYVHLQQTVPDNQLDVVIQFILSYVETWPRLIMGWNLGSVLGCLCQEPNQDDGILYLYIPKVSVELKLRLRIEMKISKIKRIKKTFP